MKHRTHRVGSFEWNWFDWSLAFVTDWWPDNGTGRRPRTLHTVFGLRCCTCRRFSFGCRKHWFCGLCESCRAKLEATEGDTQP